MKSSLPALSTPVTCAPARLASWIANDPEPPPAPLISTRTPAAAPRGALQRDRARLRDRRRLRERQLRRLVRERRLGRDRVLGEAALEREVVAVHLVTGPEAGDALADGLDPTGDVRAERAARRSAQPTDARVRRRAAQALPVAEVDRGRGHLDQHLPGARRRHRDVLDPQHVGRPVAVVDRRSHRGPPSLVIRLRTDKSVACFAKSSCTIATEGAAIRTCAVESSGGRSRCCQLDVRGLALLCGLLVLLGAAAPLARAQDPPPQDPGVTQRVFQLGGAPSEICPIKPGQTPNVDELKPTIDWEGDAAFGGLTQNFVVHAIATLTVPTAGEYTFRLRSDDGSELFIDNTLVIDHDGLHGADGQGRRDPADRRPPRPAGQLLRGGRRPGAAAELAQARRQRLHDRPDLGPEHRPRRARDRSRHEAVRGRGRHARRRAAARRRQPRLQPRQPAAGRLRAEGDRPGVDGRRPARADLGRRRRRPEQRDRRRRGVEADRRQGRRRPRRRDAHEDRRGPA